MDAVEGIDSVVGMDAVEGIGQKSRGTSRQFATWRNITKPFNMDGIKFNQTFYYLRQKVLWSEKKTKRGTLVPSRVCKEETSARGSVEEIARGGINFKIPLKHKVPEFLPRYRARKRGLPDGITGLAQSERRVVKRNRSRRIKTKAGVKSKGSQHFRGR